MASDIHTLSDSLLWKSFLEGDSSAYSLIYKRTSQDLFRYGLLYTSDRELLKDCIHDVFVKIYTNRNQLTPTDNIMAYLMVALKNTLLNTLKKSSNTCHLSENEANEFLFEDTLDTPETIYLQKEKDKHTNKTVHAMMSSLTDRQREIFFYRYIKDMSIDEISKITNMNNQSVSNSIQRALGRLRNLFKNK